MSPAAIIVLVILLLIPLWVALSRDFVKGLCYAVFLCVVMPAELRVPLPGAWPQLTIYRLVLIVLFIFWLRHRDPARRFSDAPLFGVFSFWALTNLASVIFTDVTFVISLKRYLDFVLEVALFFFLVVTSLRSREDAFAVLHAACLGVATVAALAFIEKYTAFTPVSYLQPLDPDQEEVVQRDVAGTYRHRILLGTGMAMGWPLVFALMDAGESSRWRRTKLWLISAVIIAGCYFGHSRGPWLAAALAGMVMLVLGRARIRRRLVLILSLAALVLISRPGVVETLVNAAKATTDAYTEKGGNFRYRLELWVVAWTKISESPGSLLFGCGPGAGLASTIDWNLSYRRGTEEKIWSWDNQLAYDLYQSGLLGSVAGLTLYGGVLLALFRFWRRAAPHDRGVFACLFASVVAYEFMLSNVMMFTKPVNFLFWTTAAAAFYLGLEPQAQVAAALEQHIADADGLAPRPQASPIAASS